MNIRQDTLDARQKRWNRPLRLALMFGWMLLCLLAAIPAAHAHGDDESVLPERLFMGLSAFFLTLLWLGMMTIQTIRASRNTGSKSPSLPLWLARWLTWLDRRERKRLPNRAQSALRRVHRGRKRFLFQRLRRRQ